MNAVLLSMVLAAAQAAAPGTAPTPDAAAKPAAADPVVVLETSLGPIKIELNRAKAPVTVDSGLSTVKATPHRSQR